MLSIRTARVGLAITVMTVLHLTVSTRRRYIRMFFIAQLIGITGAHHQNLSRSMILISKKDAGDAESKVKGRK